MYTEKNLPEWYCKGEDTVFLIIYCFVWRGGLEV